ncbi:hypothetical protein ACWDYJ_21730 [Streptomyces sp. NPDC003042]
MLSRAADLPDRCQRLGAITARILVELGGREGPTVAELRDSPIGGPAWLPGPSLGGEMELLATHLATPGRWPAYG